MGTVVKEETERELVVRWQDPVQATQGLVGISGMEALERIVAGEHPPAPVQELVGFDLIGGEVGSISFLYRPHESHFNPIGSVHGGIIALLLDSAMGATVHSTLAAGEAYTTLEMKVNAVKMVVPAVGEMKAEGKIIHRGNRVATVEGRLVSEDGTLYAHATSTCMIMPLPAR